MRTPEEYQRDPRGTSKEHQRNIKRIPEGDQRDVVWRKGRASGEFSLKELSSRLVSEL